MLKMSNIMLYLAISISQTIQLNREFTRISRVQMAWIRRQCGINVDILKKREVVFKIHGGQETVDYELPWAVSISISINVYDHNGHQIPDRRSVNHCSGSLISNRHVTDQHCFTEARLSMDSHFGHESNYRARIIVGKGNPDETFRHVTKEKARYVPDPDYFSTNDRKQYDWAILELLERVPNETLVSKAIVPICLAAGNQPVNDGDEVEIYGQGGVSGPNQSIIMRHTKTQIARVHYMVTGENMMAVRHWIDPGDDNGGGVTKEILIFKEYKPYCRHILIGIITTQHNEMTVAVDVRNIVGRIERLTGIQAIDYEDDNIDADK